MFLPQFDVVSELLLNRRTVTWNLIVGSKFTVFALFYFVFEGNIPSKSCRGAYIFRGLYVEGLQYFRNFTVFCVYPSDWLGCIVSFLSVYKFRKLLYRLKITKEHICIH